MSFQPPTSDAPAADEDLVVAIAATAGAAVENARLYDEFRRSRDWLTASGEVARALLADADEPVLLDVVARALSVAEADYASLILPTDEGRLRVVVTKGIGSEAFKDYVFDPAASTLGRAIVTGEGLRTHDMTLWAKDDFHNLWNFGPAMIAPLVDSLGSRGAVLLVRTVGREPFDRQDVELASTFAAQVALALQLNDARGDAEWLRVLEDRHRIAQDLHDHVIQRLFATGVGLQVIAENAPDPDLGARLHGFIADLDETIEQIRTRVFGLRTTALPPLRHPRGRYPRVARPVQVP